MTRKDYLLLSAALRNAKPTEALDRDGAYAQQHATDCESVADALASQSSGFDRQQFLTDSGVQS